jgi:NADPH-dependent ferric siderophore reductase
MEPIMLFGALTKDATTAPAIKGILATNPSRRESKIVLVVDETSYIYRVFEDKRSVDLFQ